MITKTSRCRSLQRYQSPVLVHDVVSGLRQLRQVGQQRTQVVKLRLLVETFSAEDLHQLSEADLLLQDLKHQRNPSTLIIQQDSTRSACSDDLRGCMVTEMMRWSQAGTHLEHSLAGLRMAAEVGQNGGDLVRERELWIQKPL